MARISQTDRDRLPPVWDMSQERAFIEQIMNQRFNFFLVFYSVVLAGAVNSRTQQHFFLILLLGSVVTGFLTYSIVRAHRKLGTILDVLFQDESHPATIIDKAHYKLLSVRWVIGGLIPIACTLSLFVGAYLVYQGRLRHSRAEQEFRLQALSSQVETTARRIAALESAFGACVSEVSRVKGEAVELRRALDTLRGSPRTPTGPNECLHADPTQAPVR